MYVVGGKLSIGRLGSLLDAVLAFLLCFFPPSLPVRSQSAGAPVEATMEAEAGTVNRARRGMEEEACSPFFVFSLLFAECSWLALILPETALMAISVVG